MTSDPILALVLHMLAWAGKMRGNSNPIRSKRPLSSALFLATGHHFFSGFFTYNQYKWRTYEGFRVFYLRITYNMSNIWLTRHIFVNSALRKRRISTEKLKNSTPTDFSILQYLPFRACLYVSQICISIICDDEDVGAKRVWGWVRIESQWWCIQSLFFCVH